MTMSMSASSSTIKALLPPSSNKCLPKRYRRSDMLNNTLESIIFFLSPANPYQTFSKTDRSVLTLRQIKIERINLEITFSTYRLLFLRIPVELCRPLGDQPLCCRWRTPTSFSGPQPFSCQYRSRPGIEIPQHLDRKKNVNKFPYSGTQPSSTICFQLTILSGFASVSCSWKCPGITVAPKVMYKAREVPMKGAVSA